MNRDELTNELGNKMGGINIREISQERDEYMNIRTIDQREELAREFSNLLNRMSQENYSNTPDFLLAEYLVDCLEDYEKIHNANEKWYGKKLEILG